MELYFVFESKYRFKNPFMKIWRETVMCYRYINELSQIYL